MLRGEAASLREAEASQPRDCREATCQMRSPPLMPRRNLEDIDLGCDQGRPGTRIEPSHGSERPTQADDPLYLIVGSAGIVIWGSSFSDAFAYRPSGSAPITSSPPRSGRWRSVPPATPALCTGCGLGPITGEIQIVSGLVSQHL